MPNLKSHLLVFELLYFFVKKWWKRKRTSFKNLSRRDGWWFKNQDDKQTYSSTSLSYSSMPIEEMVKVIPSNVFTIEIVFQWHRLVNQNLKIKQIISNELTVIERKVIFFFSEQFWNYVFPQSAKQMKSIETFIWRISASTVIISHTNVCTLDGDPSKRVTFLESNLNTYEGSNFFELSP